MNNQNKKDSKIRDVRKLSVCDIDQASGYQDAPRERGNDRNSAISFATFGGQMQLSTSPKTNPR